MKKLKYNLQFTIWHLLNNESGGREEKPTFKNVSQINQPDREILVSGINATGIWGLIATPSLPDVVGGGWKDLSFNLNSVLTSYGIWDKPPILTSKSVSIQLKIVLDLLPPTFTFLQVELEAHRGLFIHTATTFLLIFIKEVRPRQHSWTMSRQVHEDGY